MHTGMRGKRSFPFSIDGIMSAIIYPLLYPAAKAWGYKGDRKRPPLNVSLNVCYISFFTKSK